MVNTYNNLLVSTLKSHVLFELKSAICMMKYIQSKLANNKNRNHINTYNLVVTGGWNMTINFVAVIYTLFKNYIEVLF